MLGISAAWLLFAGQIFGADGLKTLPRSLLEFADPCRGVISDRRTWGPLGDPESCKIGWEPAAEMLGYYASTDPKNRKRALDPLLVALQQTQNTLRREAAIKGLIHMDPPAPEAIPLLVCATSAKLGDVSQLATKALVEYGPEILPRMRSEYFAGNRTVFATIAALGEPAFPILMELMEREGDITIRGGLSGSLKQFGPKAVAALPYLHDLLRSPRAGNRYAALDLIAAIGEGAAPIVPEILRVMVEANTTEAKSCARTLGKIGPAASAALPRLRELAAANSADPVVFDAAIAAIEKK